MIGRPRRYLLGLFVASALLFFLDGQGVLSTPGEALRSHVLGPVFSSANDLTTGVRNVARSLFSVRSLVKNYRSLETDRNYFRGEYLRRAAVEEENEFLRQALQLGSGVKEQLVLADVVGTDPLSRQEILLIDKGEEHGIRAGQGVVSEGRTFVGYVLDTTASSARVLLVTSQDSRIAAVLQGTGTQVTLSGSPTGALSLDLIPKDAAVTEGELVLTSGAGGSFAPNLLIGEVRRVLDSEAASFKQAVVRPFVSVDKLQQVFVMVTSDS